MMQNIQLEHTVLFSIKFTRVETFKKYFADYSYYY